MENKVKEGLFCPTDAYVKGQIHEKFAQELVDTLNERTNLHWRIDKSEFLFIGLPKLRGMGRGGSEIYNPLFRGEENVFITCAPEGSKCYMAEGLKHVLIDPSVYELYWSYIFEG